MAKSKKRGGSAARRRSAPPSELAISNPWQANVAQWNQLIKKVEAKHLIDRSDDQIKLKPDPSHVLDSAQRDLINQSLISASHPMGLSKGGPVKMLIVSAAGDDNKQADLVAQLYQMSADKLRALKTLLQGATYDPQWWGVTLTLDVRATDALVSLTDVNLYLILGGMLASHIAGIVLLVVKGLGLGLKSDIAKHRSATGIRFVVYFYCFPVAEPRPLEN